MSKLNSVLNGDKDFKEVLKGGGLSLLYRVASMFFSYGLMVYISRKLGEEGIGVYNLCLSWVAILGMVGSLGFHTSIIRYVSEYRAKGQHRNVRLIYTNVIKLIGPLGIMLGLLLFCFSDLLAIRVYDDPILARPFKLTGILLPFVVLANTNVEYIRGLKQVHISELFRNLFVHALNLGFLFLFLSMGLPTIFGLDAYAIGIGLSGLYTSFHIWRYLSGMKASEKPELEDDYSLKDQLLVSLPMIFTSFAMMLNGKVDTIMIGMYRDTATVGIFSVAVKLAIVTNFVIAALKTIAMPKISELFWSGELKRLNRMVSKSAVLIFGFTGPFSILLILFAPWILSLVKPGFETGTDALRILAVTQAINGTCGLVAGFMNMTGDQSFFARLVIISTLLNVLLNAVLIPSFGMVGAAYATLISTAMWNIGGCLRIYRKHGIKTYFSPKAAYRALR